MATAVCKLLSSGCLVVVDEVIVKSPSSPLIGTFKLRFAAQPPLLTWGWLGCTGSPLFFPSVGSWAWSPLPDSFIQWLFFQENEKPHVSGLGHCKGDSGIFCALLIIQLLNHCSTLENTFMFIYLGVFAWVHMWHIWIEIRGQLAWVAEIQNPTKVIRLGNKYPCPLSQPANSLTFFY